MATLANTPPREDKPQETTTAESNVPTTEYAPATGESPVVDDVLSDQSFQSSQDLRIESLSDAAKKGDSDALNSLNEIAKENADAQFALANMYENGEGVEVDTTKALELYKEAAAQGHVKALHYLGDIYYFGFLGSQLINDSEAANYYKQASDRGDIEAKFQLGCMYHYGQGVERNYSEAAELYEEAIQGNFEMAKSQLGELYYYGLGVSQDYNKARELYESTEPKSADVLFRLSNMYEDGLGCQKDMVKSFDLFIEARNQLDDELMAGVFRRLSTKLGNIGLNVVKNFYVVGNTLKNFLSSNTAE